MKKILLAVLLSAPAILLSGCVSPPSSGSVYRPGDAQREQTVRLGVVESVREVALQSGPSGVGAMAGGVIGGIVAGNNIGGGSGSVISGVLGAVAGSMAGQMAENRVGQRSGLEITVRLDGGERIAIAQEASEMFRPGERVRVLSGNGVSRVTR